MISTNHARHLALSTMLLAALTAHAQWTGPFGAQSRIDYVSGNAYVGTTGYSNPVVRFDVVDQADTGRIITFHAFAGTPVSGVRTTAIWGETNNSNGRALQGFNFATTGSGTGIWAETAAANGSGLRARATHTQGDSTAGFFDNASENGYGIYSVVTNMTGSAAPVAIYGESLNPTGYAGYFLGRNYFSGNTGFGSSTPAYPIDATGNQAVGVVVASNSSTAIAAAAVLGTMTSTSATIYSAGVTGINESTNGLGIGISGYHRGSGIGVYGTTTNPAGYGGYFQGKLGASLDTDLGANLSVVGSVSKGSGSFKIDHPLDPANKYLYHSFVESPDMMNIYNGNINTDASGYATITMPDYFEALNREFRYQLTIIDDTDSGFAMAKVVHEISGNEFTIRTSLPNQKVSWQVTGVRHDAFAEKNRIPNSVDKSAAEKGRYLHPAAFNLPDELAISPRPTQFGSLDGSPQRKPLARPVVPQAARPVSRPVTPRGVNEPPLTPAISSPR